MHIVVSSREIHKFLCMECYHASENQSQLRFTGDVRGRRRATRADAEAILFKGPQRERAAIQRADAEAMQIKGPERKENGDNKGRGCRGQTDERPAEG